MLYSPIRLLLSHRRRSANGACFYPAPFLQSKNFGLAVWPFLARDPFTAPSLGSFVLEVGKIAPLFHKHVGFSKLITCRPDD